MNRLLLTIDSGGSKTKLFLRTADGLLVAEQETEGFGTATDTETVHPDFLRVLKALCDSRDIAVVVCNLGGKNKEQITKTIRQVLPHAKLHVFRESEGLIGITLCRELHAQVALLAGTGSIAIAPVEDRAIISGGWGANIGDKGSGYQLGLQAISDSLEQLDGVAPMSQLAKQITGLSASPGILSAAEYCTLRDGVRNRLKPLDRAHIASFAKTVSACAAQNDPHALALLQQAGLDLADLVLRTAAKTGSSLKRVVVTGGMVHTKQFWQETFEAHLRENYQIEQVIYLPDGINDALYTLAKTMI